MKSTTWGSCWPSCNSQYTILSAAVQLDVPEQLNPMIDDFLTRLQGGRGAIGN